MKRFFTLLTLVTIVNYTVGQNTQYGTGAGNAGGANSSFGGYAGDKVTGNQNVFIGSYTGYQFTGGHFNTFLGTESGESKTGGNYNTFVGMQSGYDNYTGDSNVFIGFRAGYSETGSNKLYIDNSWTSTPLIYGDFSTDELTVNGNFHLLAAGHTYLNIDKPAGYYVESGLMFSSANSPLFYLFTDDDGTHDLKIEATGLSGEDDYNPRILIPKSNKNIFLGLSGGNVAIGTTYASNKLQVVNAYCDGNTWYNASDKNLKENFRSVAKENILDKVMQLNIEKWNYKSDGSGTIHIGPMAQDFNKIFALGGNDKAISTVDELGVALAAIQELNKKTEILQEAFQEQMKLMSALINAKTSESEQSTNAKLYQNHPNPFHQDTEISMDVPMEVQSAILYIYDLQGKPVTKRILTERGSVKLKIEGGQLAPGMYVYTLITDGIATSVKRMVLTD